MTPLSQEERNDLLKELSSLDNSRLQTYVLGAYYALYNPAAILAANPHWKDGEIEYVKLMLPVITNYAQSKGVDTIALENSAKRIAIEDKAKKAADPFLKSSEAQLLYAASLSELTKIKRKAMIKKVVIVALVIVVAYFGYKYFSKK